MELWARKSPRILQAFWRELKQIRMSTEMQAVKFVLMKVEEKKDSARN